MTRQLHELFDLPDDDESPIEQPQEEIVPESFLSDQHLEAIDKIESSLPAVKGLEASGHGRVG